MSFHDAKLRGDNLTITLTADELDCLQMCVATRQVELRHLLKAGSAAAEVQDELKMLEARIVPKVYGRGS